MFTKKSFRYCQKCHFPLNPKFKIGDIGCCDKCGWAGSPQSQSYSDWVQLKVSAILILFGLTFAWSLMNAQIQEQEMDEEVQVTYNYAPSQPENNQEN